MDDVDTSDYPKDNPLYSEKNKKVIGKFKDELKGNIMTEIVFLKAKAYAFREIDNTNKNIKESKKLKGITRSVIKNDISLDEYKNVLFSETHKPVLKIMHVLNSIDHKMYMIKCNKIAISAFDDKRYILSDGIRTLPHCDEETRKKLRKIIRKQDC